MFEFGNFCIVCGAEEQFGATLIIHARCQQSLLTTYSANNTLL